MSTPQNQAPYCPYRRCGHYWVPHRAISSFKALENVDSDFNPWKVCAHRGECIVSRHGIPHFYPSQCGPVEAIYRPHPSEWSLVEAMEAVHRRTQNLEAALNRMQPDAAVQLRAPVQGVVNRRSVASDLAEG